MTIEDLQKRSFLDPRTKLLMMITLPTFVMGNSGGDYLNVYKWIFLALPVFLLLKAKNYRAAVRGVLLYVLAYVLTWYVLPMLDSGPLYMLIGTFSMIFMGVLPCALIAVYCLGTTTVSEFIYGMEKLHIPQTITIPLSVMFRFFPTVLEETESVNNAMKMRGIRFGGYGASRMLEYRIVPALVCSLKVGDELSAASLSRGLGSPVRRTNICKIGFRLQDILIIGICLSAFVLLILSLFGVRLW